MAGELSVAERRQEILRLLSTEGRVSVGDLSQGFNVSEVTIRADLQALAERELVVRTYGGAVAANPGLQVLSLALRRQQQVQEKSQIGATAAGLVNHGDAIILDASSTALSIAQNLKNHRYVTIITNSIAVAQEMLDAPGVTVVVIGGTLRRETASLLGPEGVAAVHRFNVEKGFFGAHGLTPDEGLTDVSADEADMKRPMLARCRQVIAVIDATKWGRVGVASFATLGQINRVITDLHAPEAQVAAVRQHGVDVLLVG
jgi:DeoR family transcriptional regulator of aga operon/DeoR family fructose operon transcriptional repressor